MNISSRVFKQGVCLINHSTRCYTQACRSVRSRHAWFSKAARKARIIDAELCKAIRQVELGQADDLGGGVFKKRLNDNMYRSIILAKSGEFWVYEYLFAKKDRANIEAKDLLSFRKLVKAYETLAHEQIDRLVHDGDFVEICHDNQIQI